MTTYPSTMLFGALGQRVAVPWPQSDMGFDINTFTETTDLLSGGQSIYRAPTSYKSYAMSWKGGTLGLQPLIDVCQGMYGNGPFYTTDISSIDRNMLPARWASPYMLSYSANGWGLPTLSSQMVTPERKQVTFTAQSGDPVTGQSIVVPAVPGRPLIATAWGSISGTSITRTNLAANPNFEGQSGTANVRSNYCSNPSLEVDATGWSVGNTVTGSLAGSLGTSGGYIGSNFYRATVTGAYTANATNPPWINVPCNGMPAGTTNTFSVWVRTSVAHSIALDIVTTAPTVAEVFGSYVTTQPNTWTRISASVAFASATDMSTLQVRVRTNNADALANGETIDVDAALCEPWTDMAGTYFDGSTAAAGDYTYAWSGPAGKSGSYQQAPGFSWWQSRWFAAGGGTSFLTKTGISGNALRKLWLRGTTGLAQDVGINTPSSGAGMVPVTPGVTYTASVYVRCSVGNWITSTIQWNDASGAKISQTPNSNTQLPTANSWVRCSITATAPAGAASMQFTAGPYDNAVVMPSGATLDYDQALIEAAGTAGTYFDGSTPGSGNVTYAWSGAANASSSYLQGSGAGYGAASVKVDAFRISTGTWTAKADLIPSATPVPTVYLTAADTDPKQAGDYDAIRLTLNLPAANSLTLQHLDVSSTDPTLDTKQGKFRSGMGVGPVQFTGNVGGKLTSASIDRIGLTVDVREVERDPHN